MKKKRTANYRQIGTIYSIGQYPLASNNTGVTLCEIHGALDQIGKLTKEIDRKTAVLEYYNNIGGL